MGVEPRKMTDCNARTRPRIDGGECNVNNPLSCDISRPPDTPIGTEARAPNKKFGAHARPQAQTPIETLETRNNRSDGARRRADIIAPTKLPTLVTASSSPSASAFRSKTCLISNGNVTW